MSPNGIAAFTFTPEDGVPPAVAPFAHATAAGPTLYVTGHMPTDATGAVVGADIATQTDQVLRNLTRVTERAPSDFGAFCVAERRKPRRNRQLRSGSRQISELVATAG